MNKKYNGGFTLIETLIAIVVLGIIVTPTCSSLIMSFRMNAKTEQLLQAQLAVSSTAEILMAEGITGADNDYDIVEGIDRFPEVKVETKWGEGTEPADESASYFTVTITHAKEEAVSVTTKIRKATVSRVSE